MQIDDRYRDMIVYALKAMRDEEAHAAEWGNLQAAANVKHIDAAIEAAHAPHAVGQAVPDGKYELQDGDRTWVLQVADDGQYLYQWNKNNTYRDGSPVGCEEIWLGDFKLYRHTVPQAGTPPTLAGEGE